MSLTGGERKLLRELLEGHVLDRPDEEALRRRPRARYPLYAPGDWSLSSGKPKRFVCASTVTNLQDRGLLSTELDITPRARTLLRPL